MELYADVLLQRWALTINVSDQHCLAIASLKHDPKIVPESQQLLHTGPARNGSIWNIDQNYFWFFSFHFPPVSTTSLSKMQMRFLRPGWFLNSPQNSRPCNVFCTFCSNACLQVSRFHNTSGCLSEPSEISVLIRVVFKGKDKGLANPS